MAKSPSFSRVVALSNILLAVFGAVYLDFEWVRGDFLALKQNLSEIRVKSAVQGQQFIVKFTGTRVFFIHRHGKTREVIGSLVVRTLAAVNYDSLLGEDTIVFTNGTTSSFNIRVHGGEIIMQSLFGFEKSIHVNCTGLVREGRYPEG